MHLKSQRSVTETLIYEIFLLNGSISMIAGILNKDKIVLGMMPHPERACEAILGSSDGINIFKSI